jgi:predicted phosphodiesterase
MRWLCISDIHGDADALSAVLATAERRGYSKILAAGDLCFPGDKPLETWRRLSHANATCVQGVGDRAVATLDPKTLHGRDEHERDRLDQLRRVRGELGELVLARLARLPKVERIPIGDRTGPFAGGEILLVHGSPVDPTEPFTFDMSDEEIAALIGDDPADIIVCGGSHVPFDRVVAGVRIINVGSVGEAIGSPGSRHADATFLEIRDGVATVEQFAVPLERAA